MKTTKGEWTSERVKSLRTQLELTQVELAAKLGVSFTSVNRWENEQSQPTQLAAMRLEALERRLK